MQTVSILQPSADPPVIAFGNLVSKGQNEIIIDLPADGPSFGIGSQLVLDFPKGSNEPRRIVAVSRVAGLRLTLEVKMTHTDLREYPRMYAGIQAQYAVIPVGDPGTDAETTAWMTRQEASRQFRSPDPFMNFSATGLQFEDIKHCNDGDTLLVRLQIPKQAVVWPAVARVVRVSQIPEDQLDETSEATHRVAIHFEQLGPEAQVALREHTLKIQRAWLGDQEDSVQ